MDELCLVCNFHRSEHTGKICPDGQNQFLGLDREVEKISVPR